MKRYDLQNNDYCGDDCTADMVEDPEGTYIDFYDLVKLLTTFRDANDLKDPYSVGLSNGYECLLSCLEKRHPSYKRYEKTRDTEQ